MAFQHPNFATRAQHTTLKSRYIVVQSPMSFAGSGHRMANWIRRADDPGTTAAVIAAVMLFVAPMWWTLILGWYMTFGLFVIPWRLFRRGGRKRKLAYARHEETITTMRRQFQQPPQQPPYY